MGTPKYRRTDDRPRLKNSLNKRSQTWVKMLGDDDLDIYEDLDDFQKAEDRKSEALLAWESKYDLAMQEIASLKKENKALEKKVKAMEVNMQNLLDTAKAEMKRKEATIDQLRKEKDDLCFRRKRGRVDEFDSSAPHDKRQKVEKPKEAVGTNPFSRNPKEENQDKSRKRKSRSRSPRDSQQRDTERTQVAHDRHSSSRHRSRNRRRSPTAKRESSYSGKTRRRSRSRTRSKSPPSTNQQRGQKCEVIQTLLEEENSSKESQSPHSEVARKMLPNTSTMTPVQRYTPSNPNPKVPIKSDCIVNVENYFEESVRQTPPAKQSHSKPLPAPGSCILPDQESRNLSSNKSKLKGETPKSVTNVNSISPISYDKERTLVSQSEHVAIPGFGLFPDQGSKKLSSNKTKSQSETVKSQKQVKSVSPTICDKEKPKVTDDIPLDSQSKHLPIQGFDVFPDKKSGKDSSNKAKLNREMPKSLKKVKSVSPISYDNEKPTVACVADEIRPISPSTWVPIPGFGVFPDQESNRHSSSKSNPNREMPKSLKKVKSVSPTSYDNEKPTVACVADEIRPISPSTCVPIPGFDVCPDQESNRHSSSKSKPNREMPKSLKKVKSISPTSYDNEETTVACVADENRQISPSTCVPIPGSGVFPDQESNHHSTRKSGLKSETLETLKKVTSRRPKNSGDADSLLSRTQGVANKANFKELSRNKTNSKNEMPKKETVLPLNRNKNKLNVVSDIEKVPEAEVIAAKASSRDSDLVKESKTACTSKSVADKTVEIGSDSVAESEANSVAIVGLVGESETVSICPIVGDDTGNINIDSEPKIGFISEVSPQPIREFKTVSENPVELNIDPEPDSEPDSDENVGRTSESKIVFVNPSVQESEQESRKQSEQEPKRNIQLASERPAESIAINTIGNASETKPNTESTSCISQNADTSIKLNDDPIGAAKFSSIDNDEAPKKCIKNNSGIRIIEDIRLPKIADIGNIAIAVDSNQESIEKTESNKREFDCFNDFVDETQIDTSVSVIDDTITKSSILYAQPDSTKLDHIDEVQLESEMDKLTEGEESLHRPSPDETVVTSTSNKARQTPTDIANCSLQSSPFKYETPIQTVDQEPTEKTPLKKRKINLTETDAPAEATTDSLSTPENSIITKRCSLGNTDYEFELRDGQVLLHVKRRPRKRRTEPTE